MVTNSVLQELILGTVFHAFINRVDSEIECILSNMGDDTELGTDWRVGQMLQGTSTIWRNGLTVTS